MKRIPQGIRDVATGRAALEGVKVIGREAKSVAKRILNPELTPQQKKNQASFNQYMKNHKK